MNRIHNCLRHIHARLPEFPAQSKLLPRRRLMPPDDQAGHILKVAGAADLFEGIAAVFERWGR